MIASLRKASGLFFDVHMMVEEPGRYVTAIKEAGADLICVHQEACLHLDRTLNQIRECGLKAAVALNPATPVETLSCMLSEADMFLLMTVNPGFGGQKFIPYTLKKIRRLREMLDEAGSPADIEVDGGVSLSNVREILEAGANVIVAGSAVFRGDAAANTAEFLKIFQDFEAGRGAGGRE